MTLEIFCGHQAAVEAECEVPVSGSIALIGMAERRGATGSVERGPQSGRFMSCPAVFTVRSRGLLTGALIQRQWATLHKYLIKNKQRQLPAVFQPASHAKSHLAALWVYGP